MRGNSKREKRSMLGDIFERKCHIKKGGRIIYPLPPPHTTAFHRINLKYLKDDIRLGFSEYTKA